MSENLPHYVADYRRHVASLLKQYPFDEAMSLAIGGAYEIVGQYQLALLEEAGLSDGMSMVDLGCGSGRTARKLAAKFPNLSYIGTDVVQALLDYAASQTPRTFRYINHIECSVPAGPRSADFVIAFSLFTHLTHDETYLYMQDAHRVLKPGGKLVFSFIEFAAQRNWEIFESTVAARRANVRPHQNTFIEIPVLELWAEKLGFRVQSFDSAHPMGQSIAIWKKIA